MRVVAVLLLGVTALTSAALARPASSPDLGDFAYSARLRTYSQKEAVCVAPGGDASGGSRLAGLGYYGGMDWSPDGSRVAVAMEKPHIGPIRIARASGTEFRPVTSPRAATEQDSSPDWSPDGKGIAFSRYVYAGPRHDYRRAGLWVAEVGARIESQFSGRFPGSKDWSPSGNRLAVRFQGDLSLFNASGKVLWTISRSAESIGGVAWSPTGDLIAAEFGADVLLITPQRTVVQTITRPVSRFSSLEDGVSWSPDGTRLALGGGVVYDRAARLVERYAPPSTMEALSHAPKWSTDGTFIVYERAPVKYFAWRYGSGLELGDADLYAFRTEGSETTRLTSTPDFDEQGVVFRPAGGGGTAGTAQPCILSGTSGPDTVYATSGEDLISTGAGDDVVFGRGGGDLIAGGSGDDALTGGGGRDLIWGDSGNDRLYSRDHGWDSVFGGPGRDRAWVDGKLDVVRGVETVSARRG